VHLITGLVDTPNDAAPFVNSVVKVVGPGMTLPLFSAGQKRFRVIVNNVDGLLVDAIAIRLTPVEAAGLIDFGIYELGSIVVPQVGDKVTARGFPGLGATVVEEQTFEADVEEIHGISIRLSKPSAPGFSGSAVVNEAGLIGILHGDVGALSNMSNALVVSLDVIRDSLFQSGS
jgi:hypothetical protein